MVVFKERFQSKVNKFRTNYNEFGGGNIDLVKNLQLIIRKSGLVCGTANKKGRYKLNSSVC